MFPEDMNTSTSWDLIDPDCDAEVAVITKGQTQPQVDQTVNTNTNTHYLKMDTYLMDVNTGDHYAIYSDRIQKMSVSPKLYSAWGYRQLLQTIQNDAI